MADAFEEKAKQYMSVRAVILTSIISALAFVLALFWNDAVKSAIEQIIPSGDTLTAKFAAAIIVTIIVVIVIYILLNSQKIAEKQIAELAKMKKKQKPAEESAQEDSDQASME